MNPPSTVLIVEDSPTQLSLLSDALQQEGYSVLTARNGVEAIDRVGTHPVALILSDVMMPEINGYHLCRLLKNDPHTTHIPIILLTNLREQHDRFWGKHSGADLFLEKGSGTAPILQAVNNLLKDRPHRDAKKPAALVRRNVSVDPKARITDVLDRLFYESTISNEILNLTGLVHDIELLAREFLGFLSALVGYDAAALLLKEGHDKYLVSLQVQGTVAAGLIEELKKEVVAEAGLDTSHQSYMRYVFVEEPRIQPEADPSPLHRIESITLSEEDELLGTLVLFTREPHPVTAGLRHTLGVVADRLRVVLRYLKKFREIEEVKADFISMLVHDLRSPLTSIRGFTDALTHGLLGTLEEQQNEALGNIQDGCDRLLSLIEDILDLSKLEAGKMQIQPDPLQLSYLTDRAARDLEQLFKEKEQTLSLGVADDLPLVLADSKQIYRVFTNLLSNAAKYTPRRGHISLEVKIRPAEDCPDFPEGCMEVRITDDGIGIPSQQQKALFARYQQLPSSISMHRQGTGLGLAICKEIIDLHGTTIWVESPVKGNKGSCFAFTLPLA